MHTANHLKRQVSISPTGEEDREPLNRKGWGLCLSMMETVGQGQQSVSLGLGGGEGAP